VAAAVARVRNDDELAARLVAAGHRRLADFAATRTEQRFVDVLSSVAEAAAVVG
jgi:hypothetical protein